MSEAISNNGQEVVEEQSKAQEALKNFWRLVTNEGVQTLLRHRWGIALVVAGLIAFSTGCESSNGVLPRITELPTLPANPPTEMAPTMVPTEVLREIKVIFDSSIGAGGPVIFQTETGSSATPSPEGEVKNEKLQEAVRFAYQEQNNEIVDIAKMMNGDVYVMDGQQVIVVQEGDGEKSRAFINRFMYDELNKFMGFVQTSFTVTVDKDKPFIVSEFHPDLDELKANAGENTKHVVFDEQLRAQAISAIEQKIGGQLGDDEKEQLIVGLTSDGRVVATIVSSGAGSSKGQELRSDDVLTLWLPGPSDEAENPTQTRQELKVAESMSVVFDFEKGVFEDFQEVVEVAPGVDPEIERDENGYIELVDGLKFKSIDDMSKESSGVPNNPKLNPKRSDAKEALTMIKNEAFAALAGYGRNVDAFSREVEAGKTFEVETFEAIQSPDDGEWSVDYGGEAKLRAWDPKKGIIIMYDTAGEVPSSLPIRVTETGAVWGVSEDGQLVAFVVTSEKQVVQDTQPSAIPEIFDSKYGVVTASGLLFPLNVMAMNHSLVQNITHGEIQTYLARGREWDKYTFGDAENLIPLLIVNEIY